MSKAIVVAAGATPATRFHLDISVVGVGVEGGDGEEYETMLDNLVALALGGEPDGSRDGGGWAGVGRVGASVLVFATFTNGHPAPTTTRFWLYALGHFGGLAVRGAAHDDGLMFSGLEDGPEGMYAIAFGSGMGEAHLILVRVCEAGDFPSARLLRLGSDRVLLGRCSDGC